jgi:hypothetical protein
VHGIQEVTSSTTFTVPKGVKVLNFEIWGAGGGGGTGSTEGSGAAGGAGGSGAYVRGTINVKQSQQLTITVGAPGTAGVGAAQAGGQGGATQILNSGNIVASAGGGAGGGAAGLNSVGTDGAGGTPIQTPGFLTRAGHDAVGGFRGTAVQGSVEMTDLGTETAGGRPGIAVMGLTDGLPGGRGHVILSW